MTGHDNFYCTLFGLETYHRIGHKREQVTGQKHEFLSFIKP